MKKNVIALVIAGAFAAPAAVLADSSNVTIYGTLNADFENVKADGGAANVSSRNRVSSNSSNIGFKGSEDLGNGLKAIFQVESSVGLDNGVGTFSARNSNVGLSGGFGTVFLGNWDTPYKYSTGRLDPFGNTGIGGYSSIMGSGGSVTGGNTVTSFDRRMNNSVQYWTPSMNGFSARVAYGANEEEAASGSPSPNTWSLSAGYENGPVYITAAYDRHDEFFAADKSDDAWKIGGSYTFGNTTIGAIYEQIDFEFATGDLELRNWYLSLTHKIGPGTIRAAYTRSRDPKGSSLTGIAAGAGAPGVNNDAGAHQFVIGYGYSLSKRTEVYALYSKIENDTNATYNFATNALGGIGAGSDPRGFGLGIKHTF